MRLHEVDIPASSFSTKICHYTTFKGILPETVATIALHLVRREVRRYWILYGHGLSGLDILPVDFEK